MNEGEKLVFLESLLLGPIYPDADCGEIFNWCWSYLYLPAIRVLAALSCLKGDVFVQLYLGKQAFG